MTIVASVCHYQHTSSLRLLLLLITAGYHHDYYHDGQYHLHYGCGQVVTVVRTFRLLPSIIYITVLCHSGSHKTVTLLNGVLIIIIIVLIIALPGPPKEPKIMALYTKMESISSTGSIILAILEVHVLLGAN